MTIKQNIVYIYRWFLLIVGSIGLFLEFYPNQWYALNYFTIWSNILVVLTLFYLVIKMHFQPSELIHNTKLLRWKALVTISISLTILIFAFLLADDLEPAAFYTFDNIALHYVVPIGFIVDWLLFDERGHYKVYDPLLWTFFLLFMLSLHW